LLERHTDLGIDLRLGVVLLDKKVAIAAAAIRPGSIVLYLIANRGASKLDSSPVVVLGRQVDRGQVLQL